MSYMSLGAMLLFYTRAPIPSYTVKIMIGMITYACCVIDMCWLGLWGILKIVKVVFREVRFLRDLEPDIDRRMALICFAFSIF